MPSNTSTPPGGEEASQEAIEQYATPFGAAKTAPQDVQFAIDPSFGLTRQRYAWFSNGTQFDSTNFTENPGEITLSTTSTGSDDARIRSAFSGQYVSQAVAKPGIRIATASADTSIDSNGLVSISHGEIYFGAFWWDSGSNTIDTGIALKLDSSGLEAWWRSNGSHMGDSPVSQSDFTEDRVDGQDGNENPSGIQFDPSDGWIVNYPYWWYNAGKLRIELIDPVDNEPIALHDFNPRVNEPGEPSLDTPNLPTQMVVRNAGTSDTLEAALGGTQFSTFGSTGLKQTRDTYGTNTGHSVTTDTPSDIAPTSTTGEPIFALKRESDEEDLELRLTEFKVDTPNDITVYFYDEFGDETSALTNQSFTNTFRFNADETKTEFDRSATAYSPSTAVFRGLSPVDSGKKNQETVVQEDIEDRIPIGATRIVTATDDGNNDPSVDVFATVKEGY